MAGRVHELAVHIRDTYDGDAARVWTDAADSEALRANLLALPGFGEMKVKALGSVLAKHFGVEAARDLVPWHPTLGDVDSAAALADYQADQARPQGRMVEGPGELLDVDTPHGLARVHLHRGGRPAAALLLGHGAGGGVSAKDLVTATEVALSVGLSVALVEQPYRVAGRRSPAPARQLDAAWTAVADHLAARGALGAAAHRRRAVDGSARGLPHSGGDPRGRGPLPGVPAPAAAAASRGERPAEPSGRARRGERSDAGGAGRARPVRHSAGGRESLGRAGLRRPQPEDGLRRGGRRRAELAARGGGEGGPLYPALGLTSR